MRSLLTLLALAATAHTAASQSVVIPSAARTTRPSFSPFYVSSVFYATTSTATPSASRSQTIHDTADITVLTGAWNSLSVRRPYQLGNMNSAFSADATVVMSVSQSPWTAATTTFASNHGPNPTTVFSGVISLPDRPNPTSWPATWEAPFPFTAVFPYARSAGQSLVIDILQTRRTGTSPWYLEATGPGPGIRHDNGGQPGCRFSNGNPAVGISTWGSLLPGNTWTLTYLGVLPNVIGVAAIGAQGIGGSWNGVPLPISLAPLGAPNCSWNVEPMLIVSVAADGAGNASWPTQSIPNDPSLGGCIFFDHCAFSDPAANALGVVTGWSSKWNIGSLTGAPGALVAATGHGATSPLGTISRGTVPTLELRP